MASTKVFDALERVLSAAIERGPLRLFRARVEPLHVVRALERLIERHRLVGPRGVVVPHAFRVLLHPSDYERLIAAGTGLRDELAQQLGRHARRRGWRMLAPPVVELHPDERVPSGQVQVDLLAPSVTGEAESDPIEATAKLPVSPSPVSVVIFQTPDGATVSHSKSVVTIGRSAENDVVVADPQVSRRHAELRAGPQGFELRDLDSTNGTWVNGRRVQQATISGRVAVSLGDAEVLIQAPSQ
jgi:hypothetical protein